MVINFNIKIKNLNNQIQKMTKLNKFYLNLILIILDDTNFKFIKSECPYGYNGDACDGI